MIFFKL